MDGEVNPVLVEVLRKGVVESAHRGSAVVVNDSGEVVFSIGDPMRLIYPRSSFKYFQALPVIESGAADKYNLGAAQIALACASHDGEPIHVETARAWLQQLGLGAEDLECGATLPMCKDAARAMIAGGESPTRVHHNCSGKHCGMLTVARHLGAGTRGYSEYGHPSQAAWMQVMGEVMDLDIPSLHWERDGCGLPAVQMPSYNLALGFARFARPDRFSESRAGAVRRITDAITRFPGMVAGSGRCCSAVIEQTGGRALVKTGAEGVFGGSIPAAGLGFALKADDGATRASEVMLGALLRKLGVAGVREMTQLGQWFTPQIINSLGYQTGEIVPSPVWDALPD